MTSTQSARLMSDAPASGSWNMAVDQALLHSANSHGAVTLRFYRWEEPTLSLGYFQKLDDRNDHKPSLDCPFTRRASGGGAIIHDDELTYSICLPSSNRWSKKSIELYDLAHDSIRDALNKQAIEVSLFETPPDETVKASPNDPFLCFQRRAVGDLICDGHKVGGSAQRRLKSALIQHGSLMLSQSRCSPELPGLKELSGQTVCVNTLIETLQPLFADAFDCKFEAKEISVEELAIAKEIERETFQNDRWLERR